MEIMGDHVGIKLGICCRALPSSEQIHEQEVKVAHEESVLRHRSLAIMVDRVEVGGGSGRNVTAIDCSNCILKVREKFGVAPYLRWDGVTGWELNMGCVEWWAGQDAQYLLKVPKKPLVGHNGTYSNTYWEMVSLECRKHSPTCHTMRPVTQV